MLLLCLSHLFTTYLLISVEPRPLAVSLSSCAMWLWALFDMLRGTLVSHLFRVSFEPNTRHLWAT